MRAKESESAEERQRLLWIGLRQALLIALGAVETYLDVPRSAPPRRARRSDKKALSDPSPGPSPKRRGEREEGARHD